MHRGAAIHAEAKTGVKSRTAAETKPKRYITQCLEEQTDFILQPLCCSNMTIDIFSTTHYLNKGRGGGGAVG